MTSQTQAEKYAKTLTACRDNAAPKAALPSEFMRELTDDEIAAITGGLNPQPLPPRKFN
jgi:hypothetical protein